MIKFLEGAVLVGAFIATNIVAAGVVLVLGLMYQAAVPNWISPLPWILICAAGALAAFVFLRGLMLFAAERARLQCRAGRRGG